MSEQDILAPIFDKLTDPDRQVLCYFMESVLSDGDKATEIYNVIDEKIKARDPKNYDADFNCLFKIADEFFCRSQDTLSTMKTALHIEK